MEGTQNTQLIQDMFEMVTYIKNHALTREHGTTKEDLKPFATKEDLKSFATKEDLKPFATKEDLKPFATKDDLKPFATKDDLKPFATKEDLKPFATKDDLKPFATKEDLKPFATKEDLKPFATKDDLESFATKDDFQDIFEIVMHIKDHAATQEALDHLDQKVRGIKSTMVTKDYLDEKLADHRADLNVLVRKEDTKLRTLVDILYDKTVLDEADLKKMYEMEPYATPRIPA